MGKKKKQKKEKIVEGTPIEQIDYFGKEMEDLQKFAVKVAEELNKVRDECGALEIDRNNMIHHYGNAVFGLMKVAREIRRADRYLLHKQGLADDGVGQKTSMEAYAKLNKDREGYVGYALERYREVFQTEQEIVNQRLEERKAAWDGTLEAQLALMKARHRVRDREVSKIGEAYTRAILEAEKSAKESEERLFDVLEESADNDFRRLVLLKNKGIQEMQKAYEKRVEDVKDAFRKLKYSEITVRYREEAVRLTGETTQDAMTLAQYKDFYIKHKRIRDAAEKQANELKEMEAKREEVEATVVEKRARLHQLGEIIHKLTLETNLLEDYGEAEE